MSAQDNDTEWVSVHCVNGFTTIDSDWTSSLVEICGRYCHIIEVDKQGQRLLVKWCKPSDDRWVTTTPNGYKIVWGSPA